MNTPNRARHRILIGKPGLDGHDRGAKYVAHILRDAGFEVIYTGIRRTPEELVAVAIQEDVQAIGISLLSGAHTTLVSRIMELLRGHNATDILVFLGGIVPESDVPQLKAMGVAHIFGPGTAAQTIVETLRAALDAPAPIESAQ
jgi:methylmalonyl-CoA mutase C-terminal domain/subunit